MSQKIFFASFYPITCFSNHHKLYIIWKDKTSKFILWKPFWNQTLRYHGNRTLKSFSELLPLCGRCHIPNILWSFRIKTYIILTKYILLERSESQDSIFGIHIFHICHRHNIEREIDTFVTEKCIKKIQWSLNGTRWLFVV